MRRPGWKGKENENVMKVVGKPVDAVEPRCCNEPSHLMLTVTVRWGPEDGLLLYKEPKYASVLVLSVRIVLSSTTSLLSGTLLLVLCDLYN